MTDKPASDAKVDAPSPPPSLEVHYLKSAQYREVLCDGALGGLSPRDKIWIGFYSERYPVPRKVKHAMVATGNEDEYAIDRSKPVEVVEARTGLIRNLEFGLYLSTQSAEELYQWLGEQIHNVKKEEK